MNRKERRNLRKDKDLIKELYSIINKYLPNLLDMFDNLTDIRNKSNVAYKMKMICVTRLFSLLCCLTTYSQAQIELCCFAKLKVMRACYY